MSILVVIIPTYNRKDNLRHILTDIHNQQSCHSIKSVVIIDGSNDGTIEMLQTEFKEIDYIYGNGNWWWTKCVNEGAKFAINQLSAEYLILLNDDNRIDFDFINKIVNKAIDFPDSIIGSLSVSIEKPNRIVSSCVYDINKFTLSKKRYFAKNLLYDNLPNNMKNILLPTYCLSGRGTLIPVKIISSLNYFDEKLVQYGSDDDFCLRARKKNIMVFINSGSIVYTYVDKTAIGSSKRNDSFYLFIKSFFSRYTVNSFSKSIYFFLKHYYKILLPFYVILFMIGTVKSYLVSNLKK